jgi:hypothetical protein
VKRLRYFFNHIKDYDGTSAASQSIESRANVQPFTDADLDQVNRWMEEGTLAIGESKRFIDLIENQEM